MKLIVVTMSCIAVALLLTACTESVAPTTNALAPTTVASPAQPVDEFAAARANYQQHCEACHGETGEGGLVKVDNKQIKVASLKADHAVKHTDQQLAKMITNGEEEMPPFKEKLNPQQIVDLVKFVRKTFQGKVVGTTTR